LRFGRRNRAYYSHRCKTIAPIHRLILHVLHSLFRESVWHKLPPGLNEHAERRVECLETLKLSLILWIAKLETTKSNVASGKGIPIMFLVFNFASPLHSLDFEVSEGCLQAIARLKRPSLIDRARRHAHGPVPPTAHVKGKFRGGELFGGQFAHARREGDRDLFRRQPNLCEIPRGTKSRGPYRGSLGSLRSAGKLLTNSTAF